MPYLPFIVINLAVFWLLLSGLWDKGLLLVLGGISVAFVGLLTWRIDRLYPTELNARGLILLPLYWVWLIGEVLKANVDVLKRIWLPRRYAVNPVIKTLPMSQQTALGRTIYANSITLTPGTVSVDVMGDSVMVHAVSPKGIADLQQGEMDRRITRLERGPNA